jgi:transcription elongation factor GreA
MEGTVPVIQETYNELVKEMDHLKKVDRPEIIEAIATARENGDLKENADYHAAREKQGHIEDRIRYLEDRIARSEIIKVDPKSAEHIVFGATVSLKNVSNGKKNKISVSFIRCSRCHRRKNILRISHWEGVNRFPSR